MCNDMQSWISKDLEDFTELLNRSAYQKDK